MMGTNRQEIVVTGAAVEVRIHAQRSSDQADLGPA
jgi:hypothetical protein